MKFEKIVDGVTEYLSEKIYPTMVGWQKIVAADVVSRAIRWAEAYLNNPDSKGFLRALGYIDGEDNVDIQGITGALKKHISEKGGKWKVKIPLMPVLVFSEEDVDDLLEFIEKE